MADRDLVALTRAYVTDLTERPPRAALRRLAICDDIQGDYTVLTIGWDGPKRVVGVTLLVSISNDQIAIHHDGTPGFADYLIAHGVPEESIAITFHTPHTPERIAA